MRCSCGNVIEHPFDGLCVTCYLLQEQDVGLDEIQEDDSCIKCGGDLDVDWENNQVSCTRCGWSGEEL